MNPRRIADRKPPASQAQRQAVAAAVALALAAWIGADGAARAEGNAGTVQLTQAAAASDQGDSGAAKPARPSAVETISITAPRDVVEVPATATFTESVIPAETVRNLSPGPSTTVQTMLNEEPSIFAYTAGPNGVETSISFRSFISSQFSETYDGVSINDVFNGGVTGSAENRNNVLLTPNNLGAVQIFRGINNPAVNSYNSLGGTINFVPRQPGDKFAAEVGASGGSFGTYGAHITVDTGDYGGLKQIVSFQQDGSKGWIDGGGDYNSNLYWGADAALGGGNRVYNHLLANLNHGYTTYNMPIPLLQQYGTSYQWPANLNSAVIHDTNWLDVLGAEIRLSSVASVENKLFAGRNEYLRTSYSNPANGFNTASGYQLEDGGQTSDQAFWIQYPDVGSPSYDPVAAFGSTSQGTDYHFYGYTTWVVGDSASLKLALPGNAIAAGANITEGRLHSREYWYGSSPVPQVTGFNNAWDEHDVRTMGSLYVQDDIALAGDRLHITPGVKYVLARTGDTDAAGIYYYPVFGSVSDTEHFVSPTLGVNFQVADGLNVFTAWGRNTKLPDITSYYNSINDYPGTGITQPKMKPEYVDDYEVGARYRRGGLYAELNAYREMFKNTFIQGFNTATQLNYFLNGPTSQYQGLELQLKQDFGVVALGDLTGYFNYSHNQAAYGGAFKSVDAGGSVNAGDPVANVPKNLVSLGALWKHDGWRVNLDGRYAGAQFIPSTGGLPTNSTIPAFTVFNAGVSKTLATGSPSLGKSLRLGLNVDNLFDRHYLITATDYGSGTAPGNTLRGIYAAPRAVTGSVAVDF